MLCCSFTASSSALAGGRPRPGRRGGCAFRPLGSLRVRCVSGPRLRASWVDLCGMWTWMLQASRRAPAGSTAEALGCPGGCRARLAGWSGAALMMMSPGMPAQQEQKQSQQTSASSKQCQTTGQDQKGYGPVDVEADVDAGDGVD